MIYRYALSIIIIIISLFIMNKTQVNIPKKSVEIPQYKIACSENPIIKKNLSSIEISSIISKLENENGVIIDKLFLRKKDIFDNSYDIYIERQIPENVKVINIQLEKQNKYKNFFQGIDFDVDELWKEKNFLPESEILKFAGVVENEGNLIGYVYIGNQLIKLKNGEIKNDKRVIKIFKDGILLYDNNKKRFEVLR